MTAAGCHRGRSDDDRATHRLQRCITDTRRCRRRDRSRAGKTEGLVVEPEVAALRECSLGGGERLADHGQPNEPVACRGIVLGVREDRLVNCRSTGTRGGRDRRRSSTRAPSRRAAFGMTPGYFPLTCATHDPAKSESRSLSAALQPAITWPAVASSDPQPRSVTGGASSSSASVRVGTVRSSCSRVVWS